MPLASGLKENPILHTLSSRFLTAFAGLLLSSFACKAQTGSVAESPATTTLAAASLPDAPSALRSSSSSVDGYVPQTAQAAPNPSVTETALKYAIDIKPGQTAVPLSAGDKFQMGIRKQLTLGSLASPVISAAFGNLNNSRPHYGTDSGAFGERLGASALRQTSQSIFNYGIYSNLFHDDPRYYVLGPQYTFRHRVLYAASRVVVTRKDNGSQAPNLALMSAIASSTALTNAYYPEIDRNVQHSITGALTSLATRAATQQLREFSGDIRQRLHLKH